MFLWNHLRNCLLLWHKTWLPPEFAWAGFETRCCSCSSLLLALQIPWTHCQGCPSLLNPPTSLTPEDRPSPWQGRDAGQTLVCSGVFIGLHICCCIALKSETDSPSFGFQTGTWVFWDFTDKPGQRLYHTLICVLLLWRVMMVL